MDMSLQKMVEANDGIKFSKVKMADGILGPSRNVYGKQRTFA